MTAPDIDLDALERAASSEVGGPTAGFSPAVVLELIRRVRQAEQAADLAQLTINKLELAAGDTLLVKTDHAPSHSTVDRLRKALPHGVTVWFLDNGFDISVMSEDQMRRAGWVRAEKLEQAEADMRAVSAALAESRANDVIAMGWLADCRIASGDKGKRMLPEFVEYLRGLKANSDRYEKLRKFNVSQFQQLFHRNLRGGGSFDDLVDAWVPPF